MKFLITKYRKRILYGDCHADSDGFYFPFRGKVLEVKILGIWFTRKVWTSK